MILTSHFVQILLKNLTLTLALKERTMEALQSHTIQVIEDF